MVFSEPPLGFTRDLARGLAGTAFNLPGSGLENIYKSLTNKPNAGDSFNPNVVDVEVTNSITHHHRELLLAGYNNGRLTADLMNRYLDDPKVNPGDVRNGYFSSMIGSALFLGKISPTEAAQMTDWAYTRHGGTQPPWGDTSKPDSYLSRSDYDINKWLKAFKRRER